MSAVYHEFKGFSIERKKFTEKHSMGAPHYHYAYEIFLPLDGVMTLLIGDDVIATNNTNVVLAKKGVAHGNYSKSEHERTVIYFDDDFLDLYLTDKAKKLLLKSFEKKIVKPDKEEIKKVRALAEKMQNISVRDEAFPLLCEMLIMLKDAPSADKQTPNNFNKTLGAVLSYINLNADKIESVKSLSDTFFVSESYLCRLFKEGMGTTVSEYINTVKINEACEKLKNSDMSVTEVGFAVGYNSYTYFCKVFKRRMGVSPYKYKKGTFMMQKSI